MSAGSGRSAIVVQPGQARHETGGHPENRLRMEVVGDHLASLPEWPQREVLEAVPAPLDAVLAVHPEEHVEAIRSIALSGGGWIDADTAVSPGSFDAALEAAGGAIVAVEHALGVADEGPGVAFALLRPPGHHATVDRAMGFCLFNNAAVAVRHARDSHGSKRVAVVDWDVHHGNGTQDVFFDDPDVLFVSLHQWPLYPGTGWLSETGSGPGAGSTINVPMPPGAGDRHWVEAVREVAIPAIESFDPDLVVVSAGQDGHHLDQLSDQSLTFQGYSDLSAALAEAALGIGAGVVAVHEGGYNLETLPLLDRSVVAGFDEALGFPGNRPEPEPDPSGVLSEREWVERLDSVRAAIGD